MKKISSLLFALLLLSSFCFAQTTKTFTVKDFDKIDASYAFHIDIKKGNKFHVVAKGLEKDLKDLVVSVRNGTLILKYDTNFRTSKNKEKVEFVVTMPSLKAVDLSGATDVVIEDFKNIDNLSLDLSGASVLEVNTKIDRLDLDLSGASKLVINKHVVNLHADVSGASSLKVLESACENAEIDASGASMVRVNVNKELEVEASGASVVKYGGNPHVKKDVSGASRISKI